MFRSFYPVRSLDDQSLSALTSLLAGLDGEEPAVRDGVEGEPARDGAEGESTSDETARDGGDGETVPELVGPAAELLALWREHGEGFVADGFVRLVDPVRVAPGLPRQTLADLLGPTAQLDRAVTVAVTALGDIVLAVPGGPGESGPRMVDVMGRHGVVVDLQQAGYPEVVDLVGLFEGAPGRNALLRTEGYAEMVRSGGLPGLGDCLVPEVAQEGPGGRGPTARTAPLPEVWAGWHTEQPQVDDAQD